MHTTLDDRGLIMPGRSSIERRVLVDDALEAELCERGYVVVPLLDEAQVDHLYQAYAEVADSTTGVNSPGAYNDTYAEFSVIHSKPEFRRRAYDAIVGVLGDATDDVLDRYRPLIANYVNKPPGRGVVPAHQNWSVVDESRFRSVSVWVALVDTDVSNGAMYLYDRSHERLRGPRGMWAYESFAGIESELVEAVMTPVRVPAGHAVVLDDALVHYSPPNNEDERRLAIQFVMVPSEAEALFHTVTEKRDGSVDVDVLRIDEGFFFDFWHGDGDLDHAEVLDRVTVATPRYSMEELTGAVEGRTPPALPTEDGPVIEVAPAAGGTAMPDEPVPAAPSVPAGGQPSRFARWRAAISSKVRRSTS